MMRVVVFDPITHISSTLHDLLTGMNAAVDASLVNDWEALRREVADRPVSVVVLGPNVPPEELQNVPTISEATRPTAFILVTDDLDARSLQIAMRNGIRDVVAVHDVQVDLIPAVERARASLKVASLPEQTTVKSDANGKLVAVCGPKGGTGKTTVATNLAISSAKAGVKTALLDANPNFGDCAAFLRVRPDKTLSDVAGLGDAIDDVAVASVMMDHSSGLKLLTTSTQVLNRGAIDAPGFAGPGPGADNRWQCRPRSAQAR